MSQLTEQPGQYPFTRGIYPQMYQKKIWTMRQYSGFGTPQETNRRFKYLLEKGETGLSVAFDLPTQLGYDPDHILAAPEAGLAGVSISTYQDFKELFSDIALDKVSVSFTMTGMAPAILAMYLLLADEQGCSYENLRGTLQNDPFKEYTARGAWIVPPVPALAIATAVNCFCFKNLKKFNPLSVSGYHLSEAGADAAQEVAFAIADGLAYFDDLLSHGFTAEECAQRFTFFWAVGSQLFTEIAKLRAARRVWAQILHQKYSVAEEFCKMRFHTQTSGSALTAADPLSNLSRVTIQTLAAVLGGTQSHHACSYDEALNLPTEEAAALSIMVQKIIATESGVTESADPLGGAEYIEDLTNKMVSNIYEYLAVIEGHGGAISSLDYMAGTIDGFKRPSYVSFSETTTPVLTDNFITDLKSKIKNGATIGQIGQEFRQLYGEYHEPAAIPENPDYLLAKVGLDGHDRGAREIYQKLQKEGHQVAYTGRQHTVEEIVSLATNLKVKTVGISILSGAHNYYIPALQKALENTGIKLEFGGLLN